MSAADPLVFILGTSTQRALRIFVNGIRKTDLSAITRWVAVLSGVTVDSDANPECFDWTSASAVDTDGTSDVLILHFGTLDIPKGETSLALIYYDPDHPSGRQLDSLIPCEVQGVATGDEPALPVGTVSSSDVALVGVPGKVLTDLYNGTATALNFLSRKIEGSHYVSTDAAITDHGAAATVGSAAWCEAQTGSVIVFPPDTTYYFTTNWTPAAGGYLQIGNAVTFSIASGKTVDLSAVTTAGSFVTATGAGTFVGGSSFEGKNVRWFGGVLRPTIAVDDSVTWAWLDNSDHTPIHVGAVTISNNDIRVNYDTTYSQVLTFIATTDETLAQNGIFVGATVGLSYADISMSKIYQINGYVYANTNPSGTTLNYSTEAAPTYNSTTGEITLPITSVRLAADYAGYVVTPNEFAVAAGYTIVMDFDTSSQTSLKFHFRKFSDGTVVTGSLGYKVGFWLSGPLNMQRISLGDFSSSKHWMQDIFTSISNIWVLGLLVV